MGCKLLETCVFAFILIVPYMSSQLSTHNMCNRWLKTSVPWMDQKRFMLRPLSPATGYDQIISPADGQDMARWIGWEWVWITFQILMKDCIWLHPKVPWTSPGIRANPGVGLPHVTLSESSMPLRLPLQRHFPYWTHYWSYTATYTTLSDTPTSCSVLEKTFKTIKHQ